MIEIEFRVLKENVLLVGDKIGKKKTHYILREMKPEEQKNKGQSRGDMCVCSEHSVSPVNVSSQVQHPYSKKTTFVRLLALKLTFRLHSLVSVKGE